MGESVSEQKTASYRDHQVTPETLDLLQRSRDGYGKSGFDEIGESEGSRAPGVTLHLRGRVDAFLKDEGILLGGVVKKLKANVDEISEGKPPTAPQAEEPGGGFVKAGGYAAWFGSLGWFPPRARNLSEKVVRKYYHTVDLETLPERSELEKLSEKEFIERYGKSKEKYLQDGGGLFEEKNGGRDKLGVLRPLVQKRLAWEENMVLKDIVDYINGRSSKAKTSLDIISHIPGIACGDQILASDQKAQTGEGGKERYWQEVDAKLKDARFKTGKEFKEKWKVSKKAFIKEAVPELHKLYTEVIERKVACMGIEELKNRYYLSELRGGELLGELLGGLHSAAKDVAHLESRREEFENLKKGLLAACDVAEAKFSENEKARSARLPELNGKMLELERDHRELAYVTSEIFLDKPQNRKTALEGLSNLKRRKDNLYLFYTDARDELKEQKEQIGYTLAKLEAVKAILKKADASSIELGVLKNKLSELSPSTKETDENPKILAGLNVLKYEELEVRRKEIRENVLKDVVVSSATAEETIEKWKAYEQKIAEREKTLLPGIDAAKREWKARACHFLEMEFRTQKNRSERLSSHIEDIERVVSYLEDKFGIEDYRRLEARRAGTELEFPGDSTRDLAIRKLAFDALEKAEGKLGKEEYRKLEDRRKELKEALPRDPLLRKMAIKEIESIEEKLGLGAYKKLEARRKEVDSELEKRPETAEYERLKELKEQLGEKIRKVTLPKIDEQGLAVIPEEMSPQEIEAKLKEIKNKEDYLKSYLGEIETKFRIAGYAESDLAGRIGYLKENLPRDPKFRKLALKGIKSSPGEKCNGVNITGLEAIEDNFKQQIYEKSRLEREIKELEYRKLEAEEKKLDGRIKELEELRKNLKEAALKEKIEPLEKELGITGYTSLEEDGKRLQERIDELKKNQKIPSEIEATKNEIERKEDHLESLKNDKNIEEIEKKFGIPRYAGDDLAGRIKYLRENLPRDPTLRKIALEGMKSLPGTKGEGVNFTGIESIEDDFELVKYNKNKLVEKLRELEGKLPKDLQLELEEIERLENIKEELRLALTCEAKSESNAQGLKEIERLEKAKEELKLAKEKWLATHGTAAFDKWKEEHGVAAYKKLVEEERAIEAERSHEGWARKDAHDALVEFGKAIDSMDQELKYLKTRLEDKRQPDELRDALWGRGKYSPRRSFSYDALARNKDTSEFEQFLKKEFGLELAGDVKVKVKKNKQALSIISKSSPVISLRTYNGGNGVKLQIGDGSDGKSPKIKRLLSRTDKKTGDLVVEDYPVSMKLFNRLYREVKAGLPEELKKKVRTAGKNIEKRNKWLLSHPSSHDWGEVHRQRDALEFEVLAPGRLFSYGAIEKRGDTSEFSQYLKRKFGIELAEGATVTKGQDGTLNIHSENLPPISLFTFMDRHGVLLHIGDGNKENALGQVHRKSAGQDNVVKLIARTDPKTKELVVFPDEKRDALAVRVHDAWQKKVEGKKK